MAEAQSQNIPAPVKGWNDRDPLAQMDPLCAVRLENMFPQGTSCKSILGFRPHATGVGTGAVKTLAEYSGASGTRKLIAASGTKIYDASTYGSAATALKSSLTESKWQTIMFGNYLIMVNGTDQPLKFDGTTITDATYTGISDDSALISVCSFRNRLYFIEKNSMSYWYGGVDEVQGVLTETELSSVFESGGAIKSIGSWSFDSGNGPSTFLVVISTMGEGLVFTGEYPDSDVWSIVKRFYLPAPIGNRSTVDFEGDLLIITEAGAISLTTILNQADVSLEKVSKSDIISNAFKTAGKFYSANFGWEGFVYPRGNWFVVNVPIVENTIIEQYVMNTKTNAWCKFKGINANCWSIFNNKPYFGGAGGVVYEADTSETFNTAAIPIDIQTAYNYFGDFQNDKQFQMVRPQMTTNADITVNLQMDVDYSGKRITGTLTETGEAGSAWDTATWDVDPWAAASIHIDEWVDVTGIGKAGSILMKANIKDVTIELIAFDVVYQTGSIL